MGHRKDGTRTFSRDEWRLLAEADRRHAEDLAWLAECSRKAHGNGLSNALHPLSNVRRDAETYAPKGASPAETELFRLWASLDGVVEAWRRRAEQCDEAARHVRPGPPRGPRTKTRRPLPPGVTNALEMVFWKPRRGRPTARGPRYDEVIFGAVERRRAELGKAATIKAAIESLLIEEARDHSRSATQWLKKEFNSVRASYNRGKKLAKA